MKAEAKHETCAREQNIGGTLIENPFHLCVLPLLDNRHKAMYQTALLQIIRMHLIKLRARKCTDRVIAREIAWRTDGGNLQREAGEAQGSGRFHINRHVPRKK